MPFNYWGGKHQKPSYLAFSLPEGAQVSFFYFPTKPYLPRAPGFAAAAHPSCLCFGFTSVLLHAVLDCPAVFFPSCSHFIATLQSWLSSSKADWGLKRSTNAQSPLIQFAMFVLFYCRRIMRLF